LQKHGRVTGSEITNEHKLKHNRC